MPVRAFATDYDGTLASRGQVAPATLDALHRLKASGCKLLMVTGRELPDLRSVFAELDLFDAVVAENGALLYQPGLGESLLGPAPPAALVDELRRQAIQPLAVGRSIVATSRANEAAVTSALVALGLPWRPIFNNDSVMVLPDGVDKASGLVAGLRALGLTPADALGVGDAENDHPFLAACGVSAAVANALPALKAEVDIVTEGEEGAGVVWLIDRLLDGGLGDARRASAAAAPRSS
ncbi:MAG TPA: HAD family hydrolase [Caulobacteraceae bacterium]|nr:HAD family hydrolase [Caulobacteraceae bacterium]